MSSFREMRQAKVLQRLDAYRLRLDQIHVEEGFNLPEAPEEFEARVEGMVTFLTNGGELPALEVRDRAEGGVYVVDGHARRMAYIYAEQRGIEEVKNPDDGFVWVDVRQFKGNDIDRTVRLFTSTEGRVLSPLQQAEVMKRLRAFGWTVDQIAKRLNRSHERVRQLLDLGDANSDVQQMVQTGEVAAAVAIKAQRQHGDGAGQVLGEQLKKAKESGKTKLTAGSVEEKRVRVSALTVESARLDFLIENKAIVQQGGKMDLSKPDAKSQTGCWLFFTEDESTQAGVYPNARASIDAAISKMAEQKAG